MAHFTQPPRWTALIAALIACALVVMARPALGQSLGAPDILLPPPSALLPDAGIRIEPQFRTGAGCGATAVDGNAAALTPRCPFADGSLGLRLTRNIDLPDGQIALRMGFARGNDAALSLDRQLRQVSPARLRESTLMTLGSETRLLRGRLKLTSDFGWSQSWESAIAPSPLRPGRSGEEQGVSQRHSFEFAAIDKPGLRWKIDGTLVRTSEAFRTGSIYQPGGLLGSQGNMDRIATRFDLGEWRLRASLTDTSTIVSLTGNRKVSLGYGGVTLALTSREGRTLPQKQFALALSQSSGSSVAMEFDLFSLAPILAMQDKGLATLIPRQFSVTFDQRRTIRPTSRLRPLTSRTGVDLFGMWSTPLGDTTVSYGWDRLADRDGRPLERSSQIFVNHGFRVDDWSVNLDLLSLRTRGFDTDDDSTLYYSASVTRNFGNGAKLRFELGRDTQSIGAVNSDFSLRDKSHRAKLELDLSAPLQRRLNNASVYLTIGAQVRLNRSGYQLRFLDEIIDGGSEAYARQGLLASFGYRF